MNFKGQNQIIYKDNIKIIILLESKKHGNKECIIDLSDWNKIKNYRWHVNWRKNNPCVIADIRKPKHIVFKLHRFIMNNPNKKVIDHVNGNVFDNRKSNLRICNQSDNVKNSNTGNNNTSGYKGVSWSRYHKAWHAYLNNNNRRIFLGHFKNKIDAAIAYNQAAIKYHGGFARLNVV